MPTPASATRSRSSRPARARNGSPSPSGRYGLGRHRRRVIRAGDETVWEMWSLLDARDVLDEVEPAFSHNIRAHVERGMRADPFHVSANTDPKGNRSRRRRTKTPTCCCALSAKPTTGSSSAAQSTRPRLPMPTRPARSRRSATGATPSSPSTPSASSSTWVLERHRRSVDHSSRPHPQLIHGIYNEFDSRSRRLG